MTTITIHLYDVDAIPAYDEPTEIVTVNSKAEFNKVCADFFADYIDNVSELSMSIGMDKNGELYTEVSYPNYYEDEDEDIEVQEEYERKHYYDNYNYDYDETREED